MVSSKQISAEILHKRSRPAWLCTICDDAQMRGATLKNDYRSSG